MIPMPLDRLPMSMKAIELPSGDQLDPSSQSPHRFFQRWRLRSLEPSERMTHSGAYGVRPLMVLPANRL
jgi:hypothetical protein